MKKALIIILVILSVLGIAVALLAFVPKAVNESQVNKLASGGVKVGKTTFILNDAYEGNLKLEEDKAEFCFTTVTYTSGVTGYYGDTRTGFIKEKEHLYLIGEYSVGLDKNITIDVEECYVILELVGSEKSIANYIDLNTKNAQEHLDSGSYTSEEFKNEIARINGEKYYTATITSAKLRMDTENNKVYLLSYNTNTFTVEFSYYENGTIKNKTIKGLGLIPLDVIEYDSKGNELIDDSEREFYDNGIIKSEKIKRNEYTESYEYDVDGKIVKSIVHNDATGAISHYEFVYNKDGICTLIKCKMEDSQNNQVYSYDETLQLEYGHQILNHYNPPEFEKISNTQEFYGKEEFKNGVSIIITN